MIAVSKSSLMPSLFPQLAVKPQNFLGVYRYLSISKCKVPKVAKVEKQADVKKLVGKTVWKYQYKKIWQMAAVSGDIYVLAD